MRRAHPDKKSHFCAICQEGFMEKIEMLNHMATHVSSGETPDRLKYNYCKTQQSLADKTKVATGVFMC